MFLELVIFTSKLVQDAADYYACVEIIDACVQTGEREYDYKDNYLKNKYGLCVLNRYSNFFYLSARVLKKIGRRHGGV